MAVPLPTVLSQFFRTRRHVYLLLFLFAIFSLFFTSHRPRISLYKLSLGHRGRDAELAFLQQKVYEMQVTDKPTCLWQRFHEERYSQLGEDKKNVYIAMNFYNNEYVLPTFFQEFPHVVRRIGAERVFVSIYENGSEDKTAELLGMFGDMLTMLGVAHHIIAKGRSEYSHKENGHRINELSRFRNAAMQPLYDGVAARFVPGHKFDEVLWINDVIHCAADIFEVLLQKRIQGAGQACAVDWGGWGDHVIYDRWVLRTMTGRVFYVWEQLVKWMYPDDDAPRQPDGRGPLPELLPYDDADRLRFEANLPIQVFSCWNGATAIDAAAFLPPNNLRFRVAQHDLDEDGKPKEVTESQSECFLSSVDLWKMGLGKVVLAPRASVAYNGWNYDMHRKDQIRPAPSDLESEVIGWILKPPAKVAFQDFAAWNEPERWAPWDEQ
ncbi:glycosyltransferase family 69 protein [Peniophora sp. CONT]|nr:glycosyltransferase family 69 protein [Peniophora sp. CONT]